MAEIKQTLSRLTASQLIALADNQAQLMAPTAPAAPPIPNMAAVIGELVTAHDAAKAASDAYEQAKAALASLKTARDGAVDTLRAKVGDVAVKARSESGGDGGMMQAAGYQLASTTSVAAGPLTQPQNLAVTAGDMDGTLDASCDPAAGAKTYDWQMTTADAVNGPYATVSQTTSSSTALTGLTSGQRVWVRVRAVGTTGPGPWSDPATKIVP